MSINSTYLRSFLCRYHTTEAATPKDMRIQAKSLRDARKRFKKAHPKATLISVKEDT